MNPAVRNPRLVLSVVTMAAFFLSIDLTFVNVALPDIGRQFHASAPDLAWVVDAYTVALTSLLIPGAAVAERFGRKAVFICGMGFFAAASLAGGLAESLPLLLAARALMGIGAGMMLAPAMAITAMSFPAADRPRALAVWASAGALGMALGPVVGGLVVGALGWRWAFLLPVPVLVVGLAIGTMALPRGRGPDGIALDGWGTVLALVALPPLVAGLIEAPILGWSSPWTVGLLALGAALLALFVFYERRVPAPAFDVRVFSRPAVAGASLLLFASYVSFMGVLFLVTIELQDIAGLGPVRYGLVLVPMSAAYWLMSRVGARVARAGGARHAIGWGLAATVAAFTIPALAPNTVPWTLPALVLMGIGNGLLVPVAAAAVLNALPDRALGTSSALSVIARFAGGAVGVAAIASAVASAPTLDAGLTLGYWVGAVALLALAVAAGLQLTRTRRRTMGERGALDGGGRSWEPGQV
ncbi:MFS transporter [Mycobacterium sp. NBC_00419]|uniref:MFS transporter n=1 Tax=Mycobacterium sp. NBC_00419 TaxID=2975989 RepID=UPI002E1E5DED